MPPPASRKKGISKPTQSEFYAGAVQLPDHIMNESDLWNTSDVLALSENLVFIGLSKADDVEDRLVNGTRGEGAGG